MSKVRYNNIREKIEEREKLILINEAMHSCNSKGRKRVEPLDDVRTCYMVDRDRIIHCKSFRRLKMKTQVYIITCNDHYRTRLTHTLEVCQIARTIGRGIGLNEDLIEAIALGHDIGHVAFAHNGEEVLNELLPNGFTHNKNSIRVLSFIENDGKGLNLTSEVLDGILHHSGFSSQDKVAETLEGQVVKFSDKIAYVNHDIDDSIRAGLLKEEQLPGEVRSVLGTSHGKRIDTLVTDCIYSTISNISKGNIRVCLSPNVERAMESLRNFMFEKIYNGNFLVEERNKAKFILKQVFQYYLKHPEKMPEIYRNIVENEGLKQGVGDYIAGMSDEYCVNIFNNIYISK